MNIVLLSEGSETRFLSVSIEIFLKPFLSFFSNKKSMLEKTYYNIKKFFSNVLIATQEEYKEIINLQIKDKINYIIEPQKIRPFGAILNAAICLKYEKKLSDDDFVSIIPKSPSFLLYIIHVNPVSESLYTKNSCPNIFICKIASS